MAHPVKRVSTPDRSKQRLEHALLSLLQDFERQTGRCVEGIRINNAATYEGGRCPAAVHVRLEE